MLDPETYARRRCKRQGLTYPPLPVEEAPGKLALTPSELGTMLDGRPLILPVPVPVPMPDPDLLANMSGTVPTHEIRLWLYRRRPSLVVVGGELANVASLPGWFGDDLAWLEDETRRRVDETRRALAGLRLPSRLFRGDRERYATWVDDLREELDEASEHPADAVRLRRAKEVP